MWESREPLCARSACSWATRLSSSSSTGALRAAPTAAPLEHPGASHVAFLVDDIEATKAELEAKGIEFYGRVNTVDDGVLAGWRWVYFEDPDGYPLELVEVAYYRDQDRRAGITAYLASRS